jgi:hypothetical protein
MRAGADPGIEVSGATLFEAEGLGDALRPPVGPERSPGGGPGVNPRKCLDFRDFVCLSKTYLPRSRSFLIHFCHYKWGKIENVYICLYAYIFGLNVYIFGLKYKFSL